MDNQFNKFFAFLFDNLVDWYMTAFGSKVYWQSRAFDMVRNFSLLWCGFKRHVWIIWQRGREVGEFEYMRRMEGWRCGLDHGMEISAANQITRFEKYFLILQHLINGLNSSFAWWTRDLPTFCGNLVNTATFPTLVVDCKNSCKHWVLF